MNSILFSIISLSLIGAVHTGSYIDVEDSICCEELYVKRDLLETDVGNLLAEIDEVNDEIDHLTHKLDKFLIDQHNHWTDLKNFMTKTKPKVGEQGPPGRKGPTGPRGAKGAKGPSGEHDYKPQPI